MRELLIVRHAIALDRLTAQQQGSEDEQRPLTAEGMVKMEQAARGMARQHGCCDLILTSPLVRAEQTATILNRVYPGARLETLKQLAPGYTSQELMRALGRFREECIAIVGHEPGLSQLIATLLCDQCRGNFQMKKGAAALLQFHTGITPGGGTLLWLATPKQLRLQGKIS